MQTWPEGQFEVASQPTGTVGQHWYTQRLLLSAVMRQTQVTRGLGGFRQTLQQPVPRAGHLGGGAAWATFALPTTPVAPKALATASCSALLREIALVAKALASSSKSWVDTASPPFPTLPTGAFEPNVTRLGG